MVIPFLTVYLTTVLGFSLEKAGILASAFGLGSLTGSFFGGRLSDRVGATVVIIISLLGSGLMFISLQFATSFNTLFVLFFITSMFGEAYRPALTVVVGDCVPRTETGRTMALIRLAINIGMTLAPTLGGFVAIQLGYNFLFWIDGVTCIGGALYFMAVVGKWPKSNRESREETQSAAGKVLPPYRNRDYMLFLLATLFMSFGFIQWFHTVPVFIKTVWGFDERYIGILMGMNSLTIALIEMPAIHAIEKNRKNLVAMRIGLLWLGISFIPFLLPKALILCFVAAILWTVGELLILPLNNSAALVLAPASKRGDYMAWYWMTWSLTNILAPSLGLALASEFGFSALWSLIIILSFTSLALYLMLGKKIMPDS